MKVLMVEDEELTREGMRQSIPWEELGVTAVYTAEDGEEGLSTALREKPDIVMADVRMPRMDGISMAFAIRKELAHCRFIFVSAYCDKEYLKSAIQLSAINYIEKPVDIPEVVETLQKSISQIQEERRRQAMEEEYRAHFHGVLEEIPEEDLVPTSWKSSEQLAERIESFIRANLSDYNLSLTMLADQFDLTKQYLCWVFKKERSETINQCIVRTRLLWAKDYMRRNPSVKIREAAERSGFTDSSYFIKLYKKQENMTPADYLKSLQ
ncbi:MAG: response regulator [Eubacteriales bacterium]|nr:response regulator [Eubacteriales bacterium]